MNLDKLYEHYAKDLYFYLLSLTRDKGEAENLVQEAFYRAYLHLDELNEEKVKPWLFRVAHNAYIDSIRKNKRNLIQHKQFFEEIADTNNMEQQLIVKEQLKLVFELIQCLPEKQKQVILLITINHLTVKEVSEILNQSESYIRILLFRGRKKLKEMLEKG